MHKLATLIITYYLKYFICFLTNILQRSDRFTKQSFGMQNKFIPRTINLVPSVYSNSRCFVLILLVLSDSAFLLWFCLLTLVLSVFSGSESFSGSACLL